jgi:hypothetical protein
MHTIKTILSNNLILKICALGIAYGVWLIINHVQIVTFSVHVPVCVYNKPETWDVTTPTYVNLVLKAPRTDIGLLDMQQLAVHIDCSTLQTGINYIAIEEKHLYIPSTMNVVYYNPSPLNVTVSLKQNV